MASNVTTIQGHLKPAGYQQITTVSSAVGLTIPSTPDISIAFIQAQSQNVRWRDDGVNPSATVGMLLIANDILMYTGDLSAIKFFETAASAQLNVSYYQNKG